MLWGAVISCERLLDVARYFEVQCCVVWCRKISVMCSRCCRDCMRLLSASTAWSCWEVFWGCVGWLYVRRIYGFVFKCMVKFPNPSLVDCFARNILQSCEVLVQTEKSFSFNSCKYKPIKKYFNSGLYRTKIFFYRIEQCFIELLTYSMRTTMVGFC